MAARLLRGFDKLLSEETGLPVHVAEDPLSAVAEGTGKCLNELKFLRQVASADRTVAVTISDSETRIAERLCASADRFRQSAIRNPQSR